MPLTFLPCFSYDDFVGLPDFLIHDWEAFCSISNNSPSFVVVSCSEYTINCLCYSSISRLVHWYALGGSTCGGLVVDMGLQKG